MPIEVMEHGHSVGYTSESRVATSTVAARLSGKLPAMDKGAYNRVSQMLQSHRCMDDDLEICQIPLIDHWVFPILCKALTCTGSLHGDVHL